MATVKAFIRTNKKTDKNGVVQKNAFVRFRLTSGRETDIFHTSEIAVSPDTWDAKEQCIKKRIVFNERERMMIDDAVKARKYLILDIYENAADKKSLTSGWLETEIDKKLHPEKYAPETIDTLFKFIDKFLEDAPNRKHWKTGRLLNKETINSYHGVFRCLKLFARRIGKDDFLFVEINQTFWDSLTSFLQAETDETDANGNIKVGKTGKIKIKPAYKNNTIMGRIRYLKAILNEAVRQGYCNNSWNIPIPVSAENVDNIYLSESELRYMKDIDLSGYLRLDRVRDQFLLLAWTGCRYSDLDKIGTSDIKDGFITFRQQKTNNKVTIPLHPVVLEILEKYSYNLPQIKVRAHFNVDIKQVAKLAGITSPETITFTRGGKLVTETHPKYELVSSHTGRRSFATNMYKRGLPTLMIMSITGHTTETSFLKYIKVRQSEHAEMMKKEWEKIYK